MICMSRKQFNINIVLPNWWLFIWFWLKQSSELENFSAFHQINLRFQGRLSIVFPLKAYEWKENVNSYFFWILFFFFWLIACFIALLSNHNRSASIQWQSKPKYSIMDTILTLNEWKEKKNWNRKSLLLMKSHFND